MRSEDLIRLRHMLEPAEEAVELAKGKSRSDLDKDRVLSLALVRLVEIVGEAAWHVSEDCRAQLPEVPWQDITGDAQEARSRVLRHQHGHRLADRGQVPAGPRQVAEANP